MAAPVGPLKFWKPGKDRTLQEGQGCKKLEAGGEEKWAGEIQRAALFLSCGVPSCRRNGGRGPSGSEAVRGGELAWVLSRALQRARADSDSG